MEIDCADENLVLPHPDVGFLDGAASAPGPGPEAELPELVIRPSSGWIPINWRELVSSRELLYFLVWRDVKIRYKQTVLGVAWAVLQPLFTMLIFTVIFGRFAKIPSEGFPYAGSSSPGFYPEPSSPTGSPRRG